MMSPVLLLVACLAMLASAGLSSADCTYNISLETDPPEGATTLGQVMLKLYEDNLSTKWILLRNKCGHSKFTVSFHAICFAKPCVTLRTKAGQKWYARSLKIEVPDERSEAVINKFEFDVSHWIPKRGHSTCVFDKISYVAFGHHW